MSVTAASMVGANIARLCAERGLSQRALARLAGVHRNSVQRVVAGRMTPTVDYLQQLADALGVPLAALCVVEDTAPRAAVGEIATTRGV